MKLSRISFEYLRGQKKHTAVTIISIVIAVAFMTVILATVSVYRTAALNICRETEGTYHVVISGINKNQMLAIRNMDIFGENEIYSVSSYSSNTDVDMEMMKDQSGEIEYLLVNGMPLDENILRLDADNISLLPPSMTKITEGRLPEKDGEIVIGSANAMAWGYPKLNDTVTAELYTCAAKTGEVTPPENTPIILAQTFDVTGYNMIELKVVGFSNEMSIVDYGDTNLKSYSYLTDNFIARFSDKANDLYWDMDHSFKAAGYEIDDFDFALNQQLLNLEGKGVTAKFTMAVFFALVYLGLLFIMFLIRMVIDNSFELTAKERIKQMGLLKAVGASKKQVLSMVLWEAFYLALPGTVIGLAVGTGCAAAAFTAVKNLPYLSDVSLEYDLAAMLRFDLKPYVFISSVIIGFLWVFVSAVSTGMRSIKSSPVEAMRAGGRNEKIRISHCRTRLDKGGSFIGAYSSVSVKRNMKRYIITIVSMVMSIVLFTSFSYAIELAEGRLTNEYDEKRQPYDYTVTYSSLDAKAVNDRVDDMRASGYFDEVQQDSVMTLFGYVDKLGVSENSKLYSNGSTLINIHPINRQTFEETINTDISFEDFEASGAIMLCTSMNAENETFVVYETVPQKIAASVFLTNNVSLLDEGDFEILGGYTTDSMLYSSSDYLITAIASETTYGALIDTFGADSNTYDYQLEDGTGYRVYQRLIYSNAAEGMEEQAQIYLKNHFYDSFVNNASDKSLSYALLSVMKILGYMAIAVIALIAVINAANIISANVRARTSELAMLRACGMSGKQLYKLVLAESASFAGWGSVISLALVEAAIFVIQLPFASHFHDLSFDDIGVTFSYFEPLKYLVIAAAASFIVAAVSARYPAYKIEKSSIVENIENTER